VTLRRVLGDDVRRVHEQIDDLLDREDGLIVFFDRGRMVSYAPGFGLSGCQIALLTVEIERAVRGRRRRGANNQQEEEEEEQ
jgi:hypothetical protein